MTPERQRIAIAEACGWTECRKTGCLPSQIQGICPLGGCRSRPALSPFKNDNRQWYWLPDYLKDLNAMHEAEACKLGATQRAWIVELSKATHGDTSGRLCLHYADVAAIAHATAAQRAEAFLRTIGKWEEVER